jgi:hypothetical protein
MEDQSMKKPVTKKVKSRTPTADDHRKLADMHRAKSRLHEARADMLDVENPPPKGKGKLTIRPY